MESPFLFWVPSIAPSGLIFYTGDQFKAWKGNLFVGAMRGTLLQRIVLNAKGLPTVRESLLTELKQRFPRRQAGARWPDLPAHRRDTRRPVAT
jgi:glucose/arabinose dehydrogenase